MATPKKILILYTELAGYMVACLDALAKTGLVELHVVRFPVNPEAPFQFHIPQEISVYNRNDFDRKSLQKLAADIQPDLLLSCGWIDKDYVSLCSTYHRKIPTVLALDNHWHASAKQRVASLVAPFTIQRKFSHCWVPGEPQMGFARKLGFSPENIRTGFYACDTDLFQKYRQQARASKAATFPKVFIYAGRYVGFKGIHELWEAFVNLKQNHGWELWCLGVGDDYDKRIEHPSIRHLGFVQPDGLGEIMGKAGVYILPSQKEPWGVALQEFAAAGFPIIASDAVGAATAFLQEGKNGYYHKAGDADSIREAMQKMMDKSGVELLAMGEKSAELAATITPQMWATTLLQITDS